MDYMTKWFQTGTLSQDVLPGVTEAHNKPEGPPLFLQEI